MYENLYLFIQFPKTQEVQKAMDGRKFHEAVQLRGKYCNVFHLYTSRNYTWLFPMEYCITVSYSFLFFTYLEFFKAKL